MVDDLRGGFYLRRQAVQLISCSLRAVKKEQLKSRRADPLNLIRIVPA